MGVSCFHFLMKYKSGYFNFKTDDILRKVSSDVPRDKQGDDSAESVPCVAL